MKGVGSPSFRLKNRIKKLDALRGKGKVDMEETERNRSTPCLRQSL